MLRYSGEKKLKGERGNYLKKKKTKNKKTPFQNYYFELLVLGLLLLGFFLLWERWNIKSIAWGFITNSVRIVVNLVKNIAVRIGAIISAMETSDIIGIILILVAVILILNRAQLKIVKRYSSLSSCSKCEEDLHRTHQKMMDMLLKVLLICKVKRYKYRKYSFERITITSTIKK